MQEIKFVRISLATLSLLLIPLVAMQFNAEVNWTILDFVIAGVLIALAGLALNLILLNVKTKRRRMMAVGALALGFLYLWAELAVGIFTNLGS